MNYKHVYHAGNFADVTKHVLLCMLIECMRRKDSPFCYIDTHAGSGCYDLFSEFANKTKEYEHGIEKIIHHDNPPAPVKQYIRVIHDINNHLTSSKFGSLRFYPGSPMLAKHLIRPTDRIVACELHPDEFQSLKNMFIGDKHIAIHHTDGFLGLKAFLPPREKRGLILIDPPYEDPDEFTHIIHSLAIALKRFESGVYVIWYPIKEMNHVEKFYRTLKRDINHDIFVAELTIYPDLPNHLNGCGLAVINPPWKFDGSVQEILPWLWKALTINQQGQFRAYHLK